MSIQSATMAVLSTNEEIASRFAPYLKELHELFALHRVPFGTPAELPGLVERLGNDSAFADDVSSILRSIILREGGTVPQTELLEVLALAAAGPSLDPAQPEIQPAFRRLLSFVGTLVRRPWNVPPGDGPADPPGAARSAQTATGTEQAQPSPAPVPSFHGASDATLPPGYRPFAPRPQAHDPEPAATGEIPPARPRSERNPARALWVASACAILAVLLLIVFDRSHSPANSPGSAASGTTLVPADTPGPLNSAAAAGPDKPSAATVLPPRRKGLDRSQPSLAPSPYAGSPAAPQSGPTVAPSVAQTVQQQPSIPAASVSSGYPAASASSTTTQSAPAPASTLSGGSEMRRPAIALPRSSRGGRGGFFQVSSGVMASHLVHAADPGYPILARVAHVQGQVILQAVISTEGEVVATHVLSGHRLLRGAASSAVKKWRYRPFLVDGRPVNVATIVTVDFRDHP